MLEKKKDAGFTLVELLAVIVILAIIALISTPIIIGVIEKARKGAFEDSAYGVLDAAKLYFIDKLADTNSFSYTEIDFSGDMKDFKLGGEKPAGGSLLIDDDGEQALAIYDKDQKWCAVKTFNEEKIRIIENYKKCDKDIAENLIINGYGEYGDNTNFTSLKYDADTQSFYRESDQYAGIESDAKIPINGTDQYEQSVEVKTTNTSTVYHIGLTEYDIDDNFIPAPTIYYVNHTLTELTQDLNDGDTVVHFKDLAGWATNIPMPSAPEITKGFIFWNYKDSTGYMYPPETYSKNVWMDLFEFSNLDKTTHTITLKAPWNHGNIKAGTKVSQSYAGANYNYGLTNSTPLTPDYTLYQNRLTGYGGSPVDFTKFRHGAKYVKFLSLDNYSSMAGTRTYYKNIVLKKVQ